MPRRLPLLIALIALLVAPGVAAARAPHLTELRVWRTSAGAWIVTGDADYTKGAHTAQGLPDVHARAILTVTLRNGARAITETDTTLFSEGADRGARVHFYLRIPARAARSLGRPARIHVRATLGREATDPSGRRLGPATRQWGLPATMTIPIGGGSCINEATGAIAPCAPSPPASPPPAPTVGFQQTIGSDSALICVNFLGPGTQGAMWDNIGLSTWDDGTTIGYEGDPIVPASGTFAGGSYVDIFVDGFAQVSNGGPALTGSIPPAVLSGATGVGNASLSALPQTQGFPTTWSLPPLTQSEAAGVC